MRIYGFKDHDKLVGGPFLFALNNYLKNILCFSSRKKGPALSLETSTSRSVGKSLFRPLPVTQIRRCIHTQDRCASKQSITSIFGQCVLTTVKNTEHNCRRVRLEATREYRHTTQVISEAWSNNYTQSGCERYGSLTTFLPVVWEVLFFPSQWYPPCHLPSAKF